MPDVTSILDKIEEEEKKKKDRISAILDRVERERFAGYAVTAPSPLKLPDELRPTEGIPEKIKKFLRPPKPPREAEIRALTKEERAKEIERVAEEKRFPREYWEKRYAEVGKLPSVVPAEERLQQDYWRSPEKLIDIPGQFLTHGANMFLFGIPGFVHEKVSGEPLPVPRTELAEVTGGLGALAGMIGPGAITSPFKVAGKVANKMFGARATSMTGRFIQDIMRSTVTLGLANGMVTWAGEGTEEIVSNKLDAMLSGVATGAVFGAAPWLNLSVKYPLLSSIFRIGVGSAVIDTIHGQHPFDERTVMQKVYDYGLNIYFLRHAAPEAKARVLAKRLAKEGAEFNIRAEKEGFEVRLPDTVEKIIAELKKEGVELEYIREGVKEPEPEGSTPIYQPKNIKDPIIREREENIAKLTEKDRAEVREVQSAMEKSREEVRESEKKSFGKIINWLSTQFIDLTGRTQRELLKKGGELGREASIRADTARGAPSVAGYYTDLWSGRIYRGLTPAQETLLNETILSRGAVLSVKRKITHPWALRPESHIKAVETVPKEIQMRADVFFDSMRQPLTDFLREGIISQEAYNKLTKRQDYSPRWYPDAIDPPALDTVRRRADINVRDSGLKKLKGGDIKALEQNSRLFLDQIYSRTWSRILRNRANVALLEMARELPENGTVRVAGKGKPPPGQAEIIAWEGGKPKRMWVGEEMAKTWALSDPQTTIAFAHVMGWLSMTPVLKAFATGYNPAFAITNMPRDLALLWMATPEYSSIAPKAGMQMAIDLVSTARDAWKRKGSYIDFIKEGGGMQFLTKQGQITRAKGKLKAWQQVLGYIGETSEVWTRLALRRRALINGKKSYEATWVARNYLDFNKGGPMTKAIDKSIPYLNASVQATRGIFRAFRDRPVQSTWKVAQVGALAMGAYYANHFLDPEGWESLSDKTKARYWCFFTPFQYKDKQGNKRRLYLKIAKDQGQRVFTAIFEAMAAKSVGEMVDGDYISGVVRDAIPLMPETALPPTLEALLGYASNKDFWYNDDIWRGPEVEAKEEWTYRTSLLARQLGKVGLSPERSERALQQVFTQSNAYTNLLGFGVRAMLGELPEMQKERTMKEIMLRLPIINRIFSSTSPHEFRYSQIEEERKRIETKRWVLTREFDHILADYLRIRRETGRAEPESLQKVQDFLKGKPMQEVQRLMRRWTETEKIYDTKYRAVWKQMLGMPPEGRAKIFYNWWETSTDKQREDIKKDLANVIRTGFFTDRFWIEYNKLMGKR